MKFTIELPWPSRELFPNARLHWARKANAVKRHRAFARLETCKSGAFAQAQGRVFWRLDWWAPDRRHRDEDNLIAACKSYLDGVAEALQVDDFRFRLREIEDHEPKKGGLLKLTFWSETNDNQNDHA